MKMYKMIKTLLFLILSSGIIVSFTVVLLVGQPRLRQPVVSWIATLLRVEMGLGEVWVRWQPFGVVVDDPWVRFESGVELRLGRIEASLDGGLLRRGSLALLRLERPVLRLNETDDGAGGGMNGWGWPLRVDWLEVVDGEVWQPALAGHRGWRFHDLSILGQNLSLESFELHFAARAEPGGGLNGVVQWWRAGGVRLVAHADGIPLASMASWVGLKGMSGTLIADVKAGYHTHEGLTMEGSGHLVDGAYGGWQGDMKVNAVSVGGGLRGNIQGLVRPGPRLPFLPLTGHWLGQRGTADEAWRFRGGLESGSHGTVNFSGRQTDTGVAAVLTPDIDLKPFSMFLPPRHGLTGRLRGSVTVAWKDQAPGGALAYRLRVDHGGWSNGDQVIEGVRGAARGNGVVVGDGGHMRLDLDVAQGEWLLDTLYGNLAREQPSARLKVDWNRSGVRQVTGGIAARLGRLHSLSWKPEKNSISLQGTLERGDLGWLTEQYLGASMGKGAVRMQGIVSGSLTGTRSPVKGIDLASLAGWLQLEKGFFAGGGVQLEGVRLRLPLAAAAAPASGAGRLTVDSLMVAGETLSGLSLAPSWHGGVIVFKGGWEGALLGGRVFLEEGSVTLTEPRRMLGRGRGQGLHLFPFANKAHGMTVGFGFPRIEINAKALMLDGKVDVDLFGGLARAEGLAMQWDGPLPSWQADLAFSALDLERLTEATGIGKIKGTLAGSVSRLRMVGWQPVSFQAKVHTVPGEADQTIHVDAIENIQIFGGGAVTAPLNRGILALFKEYGYRNLGFQCALKNDMFELTGIKNENGKAWLVDGGLLPPKVEVISHQRFIPWKEMVARIQRIGQSGGKPVIR
ncbi:MAG: hypothetical protein HQL83_03975 [Magnetococcales bacterium]|nr:hypothetical protein [Magnetococcales bacterium]